MNEFNNENKLINVSAATAKEKRKKAGHYRLYYAMSGAAFLCPLGFGIYFAAQSDSVGMWAYFATALVALAVLAVVLVVIIPRHKECRSVIANFVASGGELKKTPFIDAFCVGAVKVLFSAMAALLACFVPTLITKCRGMSFGSAIKYAFECLGSFWGMDVGARDFFSFIVGMGLMAVIFALILLLIKGVSRLLK